MPEQDDLKILSEDQAARLWRRAAELQADAARRLEERSRELAPRSDETTSFPGDGYALEHVKSAAVDAGISAEFVEFAVAELRNERALVEKGQDRIDRAADRLLGHPPRSAEISRVIRAAPERVFQAMQRVFPAEPYRLVLKDTQGDDLLQGGVMVFEVPVWTGLEGTDKLSYQARGWADIRQLYVTLTPLDTDPPSSEVTIRTPLRHSRRVNFWVSSALTGVTGVGGTVAGVAVGAAAAGTLGLAPLLAGVAVAAFGATVGGGVGGATALGYRFLYRYALKRGIRALEGLLAALDVGIRTGWSFAPEPEAQKRLKSSPRPGHPEAE